VARLLKLAAKLALRVPSLLPVVRWLLPNPLALLAGKPLERRLLVYDLGDRSVALANDEKDVETVLLERAQSFPKSSVLEALLYPLIGDGVFGQPGGQKVKAARRLFIHTLAGIEDEEVIRVSRTLTREYVQRWLSGNPPSVVPICTELARLTIDIVSQCTLAQRFSDTESREFTRLFLDYQRRCIPLPLLFSERDSGSYRRTVEAMGLGKTGAALRACAGSRFLSSGRCDDRPPVSPFGTILQAAGMLDPNQPGSSCRGLDEIMVMLLAGHETTASVLSWLCWELARRPAMQQAAAAVLTHRGAATTPDTDATAPGHTDWARLDPDTLLSGLTREALRLYPPIAFFLRDVERDTMCRGKHLSRGSFLLISPWALHRHRKKWRRPDDFRPERWWIGDEHPARTHYLPYGMGARTCPGARFAEIEMKEILRVLLSECRFDVLDQRTPKPMGSLTSRPDREIHLSIKPRTADSQRHSG
jgi:cytochrome P450